MSITKEDALFQRIDESEITTVVHDAPASKKYLIFMVNDGGEADLKLGVDADYIVEVLNGYTVTFLPMVPDYICGIFNMRGQIIPVMDIRQRLGKVSECADLLIVLNYNGTQIGIIVDNVDRLIDIPNDSIGPVPSQSTQKFVSGICTIPNSTETMMVLDCEQLLAHE